MIQEYDFCVLDSSLHGHPQGIKVDRIVKLNISWKDQLAKNMIFYLSSISDKNSMQIVKPNLIARVASRNTITEKTKFEISKGCYIGFIDDVSELWMRCNDNYHMDWGDVKAVDFALGKIYSQGKKLPEWMTQCYIQVNKPPGNTLVRGLSVIGDIKLGKEKLIPKIINSYYTDGSFRWLDNRPIASSEQIVSFTASKKGIQQKTYNKCNAQGIWNTAPGVIAILDKTPTYRYAINENDENFPKQNDIIIKKDESKYVFYFNIPHNMNLYKCTFTTIDTNVHHITNPPKYTFLQINNPWIDFWGIDNESCYSVQGDLITHSYLNIIHGIQFPETSGHYFIQQTPKNILITKKTDGSVIGEIYINNDEINKIYAARWRSHKKLFNLLY
uniref:Uncharacterized protein n=1 Tax=Megaviridae environmental sample TaxID=1737588 RepID=A0A5J6VHS9_9VIRU|nr:MAG: hypothetical protein [Megaviridae environmental sample]